MPIARGLFAIGDRARADLEHRRKRSAAVAIERLGGEGARRESARETSQPHPRLVGEHRAYDALPRLDERLLALDREPAHHPVHHRGLAEEPEADLL